MGMAKKEQEKMNEPSELRCSRCGEKIMKDDIEAAKNNNWLCSDCRADWDKIEKE